MLTLRSRVDLKAMTMRGTLHSSNLNSWNFTITWFNIISRTLVVGKAYPSGEIQLVFETAPDD